MGFVVDINADVGEGLHNEALLMPYLSSCNIACGGHAGDVDTMKNVVKLAETNNVKIGAHPSFPDRENFGRLEMNMPSNELFESLTSQVNSLLKVLEAYNMKLNHIKPHGALYNLAVKDNNISEVILKVVKLLPYPVKLYAPYQSVVSKSATAQNIEVVFEAFADRNYNDDLSLVSRQKSDAIISEKSEVFEHVFQMISNQKVKTINRVEVPIKTSTFCVHGDTENAVEILKYLHANLKQKGIQIV
ncbi:MAG: 5-oxoprolinase subunit PxpA [Winogradskyella sp.]